MTHGAEKLAQMSDTRYLVSDTKTFEEKNTGEMYSLSRAN